MDKFLLNKKNFYMLFFVLLFVLVAFFLLFGIDTIGVAGKIEEIESNIAVMQEDCSELEQENSKMRAMLDSGNFAEYYEKRAKEIGYIYPGDHIYYVP